MLSDKEQFINLVRTLSIPFVTKTVVSGFGPGGDDPGEITTIYPSQGGTGMVFHFDVAGAFVCSESE